jgi:hypothetical protein
MIYYFRQDWSSAGVLDAEIDMSSVTGEHQGLQISGKVIHYYPDGKKHNETWWKKHGPDSLYKSWYPNGKLEFTCKVYDGTVAAAPDIWNEQGVKQKPGTKSYNTIFNDKVVPQLNISRAVYDPATDGIIYTPRYDMQERDQEGYAVAVEEEPEWNSRDTKIYEKADEPPTYGSTPEGFDEYMLSSIRPEFFWMEKLPVNDSIVISFVVLPSGEISTISKEHVPQSHENLVLEVETAASRATSWCPARIKKLAVNYRMRYTLRFGELQRLISGAGKLY